VAQYQHVPTCLLDLTESPLVAAFFACRDAAQLPEPEQLTDGAICQIRINYVADHLNNEKVKE
jgi:FRG domain